MKNFRHSASVLYMKVIRKSVDLCFSFYQNTNEDHHIPQMNCFLSEYCAAIVAAPESYHMRLNYGNGR